MLGDRMVCARCQLDIEHHPPKWRDRGNNTHCPEGAQAYRTGRLNVHTPLMTHTMLLRPGFRIEVWTPKRRGHGRAGYRWVQGWDVQDPATGRWSAPMRRNEALNYAAQLLTAYRKAQK